MLNDPSGHLFVIAAPSGAGKTSLVNSLIQQVPQLKVSISHTTRAKRANEVDGENYFFINPTQFHELIDKKAFLEHAEVFGHYYGTTRDWVTQHLSQGTDVILEIDWQGARQIKLSYPDAVSIFVLPPSIKTLRQRLETRAQDSPETIKQRLALARQDISHHLEYDYLVINDDFRTAVEQLKAIITCQRLTTNNQSTQHVNLIKNLLE